MPLLRAAARTAVIAGTASAVAGGVQHRQQQRWANQEAQQQAQAQQQYAPPPQAYAPPPPAPAPAASDTSAQLAEIEKLGELKAKGLLTEEEFSAKKAQILGL